LELARDFAKAAKSAATQRAYRSDIAILVEWRPTNQVVQADQLFWPPSFDAVSWQGDF
jgi:hypothetical protein